MTLPSFYKNGSSIKLYEPLFDLFGVNQNGVVEFSFHDAVKIAGHACPTVAGAFLMAFHGARVLYPEQTPIRGNFKLLFSDDEASGTTGVIATVMSSILGAAGGGGFKGLAGQFSRDNKLLYNQAIATKVAVVRTDTNAIAYIDYHPELVPASAETSQLLSKILGNKATPEEKNIFHTLWNQRLEAILKIGFQESGIITVF